MRLPTRPFSKYLTASAGPPNPPLGGFLLPPKDLYACGKTAYTGSPVCENLCCPQVVSVLYKTYDFLHTTQKRGKGFAQQAGVAGTDLGMTFVLFKEVRNSEAHPFDAHPGSSCAGTVG